MRFSSNLFSASMIASAPIVFLAFSLWALALPPPSNAETINLFTNAARERADAHETKRIVRSNSNRRHRARARSRAKVSSSSNTTAEDFQVDSVDEIIETSDARRRLISEYRGIEYLKYINGEVDRQLDDLESRSVAEKLMILETADSLSAYLMRSPLAEWYKEAVRKVRTIHDYTTVGVTSGDNMQVNVGQGSTRENQLFRFKLHASARRGVEPRIEFNDNFRLKYDALHKDTLLEYDFDF